MYLHPLVFTPTQETYLSYVATDLSDLRQELYSGHPLIRAQPSLTCKVMDVGNESLEQVLQARIRTARVDCMHIGRDGLDCEIFERGDIDQRGIHDGLRTWCSGLLAG